MDHQLVRAIEKALDWSGPDGLGRTFATGSLADRSLCSRLLTPTRLLDLVMRRSLAPHRLQMLVDGSFLHPQNYLTMATVRRGDAVPMVDMHRLGQLLQSGCTMVVDEVNTYDPTMEVACRALQWWSRELVQVNTYLTTGEAAGFNLHWDDHDVVIVQLAGEKSWEVRGPSRPAPMFRDAAPTSEPSQDVVWSGTLNVGDVMHIPRGYWHQATRQDSGDGYSLHVTFGFTKRTGVDWLTWLADQARHEELFRHDLDRWGPAETRAGQADALVDAASNLVDARSVTSFLEARERQRPAARHVATRGIFGAPSAVVCVADFPPHLETRGEVVTLIAARKEIDFAGRALPALRLLLSGVPVDIAEVAAETGVNAALLADTLVAEDMCAEVTPELASGYAGLATGAS
jgi:hypothetical protein